MRQLESNESRRGAGWGSPDLTDTGLGGKRGHQSACRAVRPRRCWGPLYDATRAPPGGNRAWVLRRGGRGPLLSAARDALFPLARSAVQPADSVGRWWARDRLLSRGSEYPRDLVDDAWECRSGGGPGLCAALPVRAGLPLRAGVSRVRSAGGEPLLGVDEPRGRRGLPALARAESCVLPFASWASRSAAARPARWRARPRPRTRSCWSFHSTPWETSPPGISPFCPSG
jgi:hypothetical protein